MKLPILTYHDIAISTPSDPDARVYSLDRQMFENHLGYLKDATVPALLLNDVVRLAKSHDPRFSRAVCLTFDDGRASAYSAVFPLLVKYGMKATFFVVTSRVGTRDCMSWRELKEMSGAGMSIQSHSHTHPMLSRCTAAQVRDELSRSKHAIEQQLRTPVVAFAIPGRDDHPDLPSLVRACGYQAMCTSNVGVNHAPFDLYKLRRLSVARAHSYEEFVSFVTADPFTIFKHQLRAVCLDVLRTSLGLERYNALRAWLLGTGRENEGDE